MRERHQELILRLQRENLTRDLKKVKGNHKAISALRAIFIALINALTKSF